MAKSKRYLSDIELRLIFFEVFGIEKVVIELSSLDELHDKVAALISLKHVVETNEERVVCELQDCLFL